MRTHLKRYFLHEIQVLSGMMIPARVLQFINCVLVHRNISPKFLCKFNNHAGTHRERILKLGKGQTDNFSASLHSHCKQETMIYCRVIGHN